MFVRSIYICSSVEQGLRYFNEAKCGANHDGCQTILLDFVEPAASSDKHFNDFGATVCTGYQ
jgi:hypothetical protein